MHTKLFVGTRLTPELKARIGNLPEEGFQPIPYEGKEYIGIYLDTRHPTVQEIRHVSESFIEKLQTHLPDLRADTLSIVLFPQVFLG